jgi:hypothetical protein
VRKRHIVVRSEQERARLHTMIGRGVAPAGALTHARILLKANQGEAGPGWTDAAIDRKPPARSYRRRLDGRQEARLVALTCSAPPEGHKRWTLRPLANRLVALGGGRLGVVPDGPPGLEATQLKPWLTQRWCIPPEQDAEFCWRMEDGLAVSTRPND